MSTDTLTRPPTTSPVLDRSNGAGDHDLFAHYVKADKIVDAAVSGEPIRALCGKTWVPNRDPQKFPVCPECKEAWLKLA